MGTCVLMGALSVVWPGMADAGWAAGSAFIAAATVCLVAHRRSPKHMADPEPPLALATLGLAILVQRTLTLAFQAQDHTPSPLITASAVQAGIIALLTTALTTTGTRSLKARFRTS